MYKFTGDPLPGHIGVITRGRWAGYLLEIEQVIEKTAPKKRLVSGSVDETTLRVKVRADHVDIIDSVREQPEFWLVRIPENMENISLSDLAEQRVKQLYSVYLFNRNEVTHLCEFAKSYFLNYVGFSYDWMPAEGLSESALDELYMELEDIFAGSEDIYVHCTQIERLMGSDRVAYVGNGMDYGFFDCDVPRDDEDPQYEINRDEAFERCREYVCGGGLTDFGTRCCCAHCGNPITKKNTND